MNLRLILLSALALSAPAFADETFRCGKWIISSELSLAELTQKCGEPAHRESDTQDVFVRNLNNGLMVKAGETTVETWTYDRGVNAPMVVTIVDGRIKSIDRKK